MNCEWCSINLENKHKDHVFSRLLGGQLTDDLWVYDCNECRRIISKAEDEVAHRSYFALFRLAAGLKPRHSNRLSSGIIEPKIRLVKDPTSGRYSVFSVRVGKQAPEILPALEVDSKNDMLYFHGTGSDSSAKLIAEICNFFDSLSYTAGVHGELSAPMLEEFDKSILDDPDFNPIIFLSPRGRLEICSRTAEECIKLMQFIGELSKRDEFRNYKSKAWATWNIPSGTPHHTTFVYDRRKFDQIILKIALGLLGAYLRLSNAHPWHCPLHDMVRGATILPEGFIKHFRLKDYTTKSINEQLIALVAPGKNNLKAIVAIYGEFYSIDLAEELNPPKLTGPVGAFCHASEPRKQRWYSNNEAYDYAETLINK